MYRIEVAGKSEKGPHRATNEDAYLIDANTGLVLVADGMGGQQAGECASEIAVANIHMDVRRYLHRAETDEEIASILRRAVIRANNEILSLAQIEPGYRGMGTTVVFAAIRGERAYVGGIGDSRCYHWRDGTLRQITEDHSLMAALRRIGRLPENELANSRLQHTLYKYLGSKEAMTGPDIVVLAIRPGDRLLLATDGLTGALTDDQIASIIGNSQHPGEAVDRLIQEALLAGSRDNITCVVIFILPPEGRDENAA